MSNITVARPEQPWSSRPAGSERRPGLRALIAASLVACVALVATVCIG